MTAFNKSNWTRTVGSEHATQYFPGAIPNVAIPANSTSIITLTVQFQFKGNGPVDVSLPAGVTLPTGVSLGEAVLIAPAAGSYGAGNHPRISFKVINSTIAAQTPAATDVIATQF